ncbi:Proteasome component (PCI) domain-containing protein [Hirschfeldia incana]|nr:Proteasome component (PCI) domain-containing protein [Hirschfeldia incana]
MMVRCIRDAAGKLQETALDASTKGNRYINSCLRLNEKIKGVETLADRLKHLRRNVDVLDTAVNKLLHLINVGQKQDALQVLHDLITSRSFRSWQKPHEKIMFRYVELCVDLKMGNFAKDGLIQYRNSCQQVNVTSFEEVTKQFVRLATDKAEQALDKDALDKEALDVDDLEVTPWFKFLWETYRTVLEILRNNSKLQALYAMTAYKAFQFCKKYKRPTEFRRVCETMRNNLANLDKYRDQRDRPDLTEPETLQLYLDTRFEQLKVATELGLWQEAFRSVEDIYGLMCMVKRTPKSSLLVVYYSKLTEIFWTSSSHLYHAYAMLKLFSLQKNFNKKLTQKDLQLLASSVVLAVLSVPPFGQAQNGASRSEFDTEKEGNLRMANLISFNLEPKFECRDMLSRESLLSDLVSSGVLSCATQEVKDLYHQLEHEFHPLELGSNTKPLLDRISKLGGKLSTAPSLPEVHLSQYVPSLEKLATLRLLQHVSKMYQTTRIEFLAQLVPFMDFSDVEKISVEAAKHNFVAMKVDHVKGFVTFGNMDIESDGLRDPLTIFAETMNKVRGMLFPASSKLGDIAPNLGETVEKEHKRLLARQSIIEKRKEEQERLQLEMEHEEEQRKLKLRMQTEEAEQKRLASEVEERRRQRILREIEERELEKAQALLENTERHQINIEEMEKKLSKLAKIMDYLERAKREESIPLIEAAYQQRLVVEIESHEQEQQREVELSKERHERELKEKRRVATMLSSESFVENMVIFQNRVIRLREAEFERQKREKEEHLQARKQERDVKRKRIYYLKCEEERIRKLQEEEDRKQRGPSQSSAKYIPKFRLSQASEVSASADDQWGSRRRQHSGRDNSAPLVEGDQCGNRGERPGGDSWGSEEGRYAFRSSIPRSSFSSRTSQR